MLRRTRLIEQVALRQHRRWVFEAGAGFGKSVLIDQLTASADAPFLIVERPTRGSNLMDFGRQIIAAAHRIGNPALATLLEADLQPGSVAQVLGESGHHLAVDDVHLWDEVTHRHVLALSASAGRDMVVVLSGRLLAGPLESVLDIEQWQSITSGDLAFTEAETAAELAQRGMDGRTATVLQRLTSGWPLAVNAGLSRMEEAADPTAALAELGRSTAFVDGLLDQYLADLGDSDLTTSVVLAGLQRFDDEATRLLGASGIAQRIAVAGLPIERRSNGWWQFPDNVRAVLTRKSETPIELPHALLDHLISRGQVHDAINACLAAGDRERAAGLIAGLTLDQEANLDVDRLNAAMTSIGTAAKAAPRSLFVQAHVHAVNGQTDSGLAHIEEAARLLQSQDPGLEDPVHLEVLLTLGVWRVFDGDFDEAQSILDRAAPHIDTGARTALTAQYHDLRGVLHHGLGTDSDLKTATDALTEALSIWRHLREPRAAAVTSFRLAAGVLAARGRRSDALALLDSLPSVGPMTLLNTARLGLERAIILPFVGRASEVPDAVSETKRIAKLLEHDWLYAWSITTEIIAASALHNQSQVSELWHEFQAGGWIVMGDVTHAFRLCEIAESLARVGLSGEASTSLAKAQATPGVPDWILKTCAASVSARGGDPSEALLVLDELTLRDDIERAERWNLHLLAACAHWRLGNSVDAAKQLDTAFDSAAEIGEPKLPTFIDADLVRSIRQEPAADLPSAGPAESPIIGISLFDEFSVHVGDEVVAAPPGQPSTLIKLLVLGGGSLLIDQIIDQLWPDSDLELGRRRMRNVLKRARDGFADAVSRTGDVISLSSTVTSDYASAGLAADAALKAGATPEVVARAIALNDRPLLPADRYEAYAEDAREQMAHRLVRLLDQQAALAEAAAETELAVSALERAFTIDPHDRRRLDRAAALLHENGQSAAADALLRRY